MHEKSWCFALLQDTGCFEVGYCGLVGGVSSASAGKQRSWQLRALRAHGGDTKKFGGLTCFL